MIKMMIINHVTLTWRVADDVVLKVTKVPAEQPQCKSLSNRKCFKWPNPQERLSFSLQSLRLAHAVHTEQLTLQAICVHFGSGSWAQPLDAHAETYTSPQQNRRRICSVTLVFVTHVTAAFTHCMRLPSTSTRPSLPEGKNGHRANHTEPTLETTSSLTSGRPMREVTRAGA